MPFEDSNSSLTMPPHQIFVESNNKPETAPETDSRPSALGGNSSHGKSKPVGNIMATEPEEGNEDTALMAMKRQNTSPAEEGEEEGDGDSVTSALSSVAGAARMNSVHRRKLRQQLEKGTGAGGSTGASSAVAETSQDGDNAWKKAPTAGRVGNWREMYTVEVTENANGAPALEAEQPVEIVQNVIPTPPAPTLAPSPVLTSTPHHVYVHHEEGGDLAGGTPAPLPPPRVHMQVLPPQAPYDSHYAHHGPPPPHSHGHSPYQQHYHPHGPPPPPHGAVRYAPVPPVHDDRRGHGAPHHTEYDASYRNLFVPKAKPNFAGCNVRFGDLEIRVYERILGDNPSCSSGPPIGIGWNFYSFTTPSAAPSNAGSSFRELSDNEDEDTQGGGGGADRSTRTELVVSLEKYERTRGPRCESHDLVLPRQTREELLVEAGYTRGQMAEAVRQNLKVKHQRRQTVTNIKLEDAEEMVEKALRSLKRMFLSGDKRKKSRTNFLYVEWLEQSQHRGHMSGRQPSRRTQSILIENDDDKNRRNSQRGSTRLMSMEDK